MSRRKRRSAARTPKAPASGSGASPSREEGARDSGGGEAFPARANGVAVLALLAVVGLAYFNALDAAFVYDDHGSIVENHHVHWNSLSFEAARAAWLESPTRRWVANWSFGLNYLLFGLDARAFHAVNIGIHGLAAVGVYLLLFQLLRTTRPALDSRSLRALAWVGAAIFAAHPIQTQAVTYVVQRMASLSGLFCIASLLCYARARAPFVQRRLGWFAASAGCWLLAVGSKESAAAFPVVLWAYEGLFVPGANRRALLRMAGAVGLAGAVTLVSMRLNYIDPFRDYMYHDFTVGERLLSQGRVLWEYASLIAWPHPSRLVLMHEFPYSRGWFEPATTALGWLALVGVAAFGVHSARRRPMMAFGILWIGAALVVESSVFPLRLVHEHRLYLPMAGIAILICAALEPLARRSPRAVVVAALPIVALLGAATHVRNEVWQDRETLWSDVVAKSPGHAGAHQNLGSAYLDEGRLDEAQAQFERGREVDPDFGGNYRALGAVHAMRGEHEQAIVLFERAARLDPLDHFAFAQWGATLEIVGRSEEALPPLREAIRIFEHPKSQNHLGKALASLGRYEEAILHHRRALELDPEYGHARVALGHALQSTGGVAEARASFDAAMGTEAEPDARVALAGLEWAAGNAAAARSQLRGALELTPDAEVAANNLAWMLAAVPNPSASDVVEAQRWAEVAAAAHAALDAPPDVGLLDTQALVHAAAGRMEEAVAVAERAVELARERAEHDLAADVAARAELYRRGERYVDPLAAPASAVR